jgi:hypothetical protein
LGGYLLFNSDPGIVSIGGAVVALTGMSVYTTLNLQESQENAGKQLPKHSLPPPKPKPDSEDNKDLSVNITNNNIVV